MWVYLLLEFQSARDPRLVLRMLGCVAALYEELECIEVLDTRERIALERGSDV